MDENKLNFEDKQEDVIIDIPKDVRYINTQAYDKSISDLMRMINEKDLLLDPDYQRNYVWDNKKASKLIESIILNVPIPVIYVSQEEDESWTVIDGLQRLSSLKRYFDNKFKLSGLDVLLELNKLDFKSLPLKSKRILKNGLLRVIMITHDSNEEIKYDVFMRLNTGSVHLTEQELRNCMYRGKLNDFLKAEAKNEKWLALLGLKEPHKRMADRELLLRFLALYNSWNPQSEIVEGYKGRMKSFLNNFMKMYKDNNAKVKLWKTLCDDVIEKVYSVYGLNAFKRIHSDGSVERSYNRAIMDVLMISSASYSFEALMAKKEILRSSFHQKTLNKDYERSLLSGTSDMKVLNFRISQWIREMNGLMAK